MSITGNLRTLELAELLQWLAQGQKTGALVVTFGELEKRIYFRAGKIVSSESNNPEEHLGSFLIREGMIDETTLSRAVRLQESTQILLGKVLVTLGSISEEQLHRVLQKKTEESIYDLFSWPEGDFHFVPDDLPELPMVAVELDATNIVLEAMRRIDEARRDHQEISGDRAAQYTHEIEEALGEDPLESSDTESTEALSEPFETEPLVPGEPAVDTDGSSPDVRGYYHSGAHKTVDRTPLVAAAAAVLVIVIGLIAYFFMRPEPAAGVADRLGLDTDSAPGPIALAPDYDDWRAEIVERPEPREPESAVEAAAQNPAATLEQPPRPRSEPVRDVRAQYEAELAALRDQLAEARLAAAERDTAVERLQQLEEQVAIQQSNPVSGESAFPQTENPLDDLQEFRTEIAAGGDEPPTLTGALPATDAEREAGTDFAQEMVEPAPDLAAPTAVEEIDAAEESIPTETIGPATPPVLLSRPRPRYPPAALRLSKQAVVTVRLLIDEQGKVAEAELAGPRAGLGFDQSALAAARRTSWEPATRGGEPVSMWTELRIAFQP